MARLQLRVGLVRSAQLALQGIQKQIQELRRHLEGKKTTAAPPPTAQLPRAPRPAGTVEVLARCRRKS
jgi:hypothetical protein